MLFTVCGAFTTIGADDLCSLTSANDTVESEIIEEGLEGAKASTAEVTAAGGAAGAAAVIVGTSPAGAGIFIDSNNAFLYPDILVP